MGVAVLVLTVDGCAGGDPWAAGAGRSRAAGATSPPTATVTATAATTPTPTATASVQTIDEAALRASWAELEEDLSGEAGIVVMPVGGDGDDAVALGDVTSAMAWSTIKVPIAVAAVAAHPGSAQISSLVQQAITQSSNEAAEELWESLGSSDQARAATDKVLAAAGDRETEAGENRTLGRTAFGYTTWDLDDQATFLSGLACTDAADPVITRMGQVIDDQSWGLGNLDGAHYKGGWGDYEGTYTSRQMGLIPVDGTLDDSPAVVVTMAVIEPDGDGTDDLDTIADWVEDHLDDLPSGSCASG